MVAGLDHVSEGCGVRKPRRLRGVQRETVSRESRLAGAQAHDRHDVLVAFSPQTREVPGDEKGALGGKKQPHGDPGDPADSAQGDHGDPVAFAPTPRLVGSVVPGKRPAGKPDALGNDGHRRTGGGRRDLLVSDASPASKPAMLPPYGATITPPRPGKPGRPKKPYPVAPAGLLEATVHKTRDKGRVVHGAPRMVFGEADAVGAALAAAPVRPALHTAWVERHHGTERHRNGRTVRKTAGFSKDWQVHPAVTSCTMSSYNFCWPVRTLRFPQTEGGW